MNVGIYGIGNFGYAIVRHLDRKNIHDLHLHAYDRNEDVRNSLTKHLFHPELPKKYTVSERVTIHATPRNLIEQSDIIILAVASNATREVCAHIKKYVKSPVIIANTAKALDYKEGYRLSELVREILGDKLEAYAVLAGGTIAADMFEHEPLGATLACSDAKILRKLVDLLQSDELYIYGSRDVAGTEYASAFKNIISILAGITKGLGFSFGSETRIISRSADEAERLILKNFGGKKETFAMGSQCWGNDLWMSCLGNTRNRQLGILIGEHRNFAKAVDIMHENKKTAEGLNTLKFLSKTHDLDHYPTLNALLRLFKEEIDLAEFKKQIFNK